MTNWNISTVKHSLYRNNLVILIEQFLWNRKKQTSNNIQQQQQQQQQQEQQQQQQQQQQGYWNISSQINVI